MEAYIDGKLSEKADIGELFEDTGLLSQVREELLQKADGM